jgi:hypothetical protein
VPIATGGPAVRGGEEIDVRHIFEFVRLHPLHTGVVGFFLFVVISALFLERARYRQH